MSLVRNGGVFAVVRGQMDTTARAPSLHSWNPPVLLDRIPGFPGLTGFFEAPPFYRLSNPLEPLEPLEPVEPLEHLEPFEPLEPHSLNTKFNGGTKARR